jgi:molecular chaperone GrpE
MMSEIENQPDLTTLGEEATTPQETTVIFANNAQEQPTTVINSEAPYTDTAPPSDVDSFKAQIAELSEQRDTAQNQYIRIAADFDNFRKRNAKEKEDLELRVKCTTISDLLVVVDNFERARTQIKPQNDGELAIHKSYQGVYKQLVDGLKKSGVSPMRPEGQIFDPNLHEAVVRQPTEEYPEGTVMEELQRGYFLGDKILRHALVKVATPVEQLTADDAVVGLEEAE